MLAQKTSYHLRNFLMLGDASSFFCSRIYQSSNTTTPSHKNPPPGEGPARSGRSSAAECLAECFGPRQPLASRTFGDSRWPRAVVLSFSCWMPFKMFKVVLGGGIVMLTMGQPEYHLEHGQMINLWVNVSLMVWDMGLCLINPLMRLSAED